MCTRIVQDVCKTCARCAQDVCKMCARCVQGVRKICARCVLNESPGKFSLASVPPRKLEMVIPSNFSSFSFFSLLALLGASINGGS